MQRFGVVFTTIFVFTFMLVFPCTASAVEVAPRISDREIVESLAELKQQQNALNQRITDLIHNLDKRFDAIDKRFEAIDRNIDKRFKAVDKRFEANDKRFDAIDRRFEAIDRRFEAMMSWMLTMFGIVITLILGLFGYMIWDRRTALKPLRDRMATLEESTSQLNKRFEIDNPSGSLLERLVAAFRELAKTDKKVADILRSFSLL